MATKRIPLNRPLKQQISAEALTAFRQMEAATTSEAWSEAHSRLHSALRLKPWQWPAVESPRLPCPYPAESAAAKHWLNDAARLAAVERYRAVVEATGSEGR